MSGVKTSGEGRAEIVIAVIRIVAVHVRAVGISIADDHNVTVGVENFPYLLAVCGINRTKCILGTSGTVCISMWREISRTRRR